MLLAAMGRAAAVAAAPMVSNVTVSTLSGGTCAGDELSAPASLDVLWSVGNGDATLYQIKVYEDDVLVGTYGGTATGHQKTVEGYVEDETNNSFTSSWVFRVDMVRISDGQVVSSDDAAAWVQLYGTCGEGEA